MYGRNALLRPNTIKFRPEFRITPEEVYYATNKELEERDTVKCIAELNTGWYNVYFNNEANCEQIALNGIKVNGILIECERASVQNSVVVYVNAPHEMSDQTVTTALSAYGTVSNIRHQTYDFDANVETGVRSLLIKSVKKPIPSFLKVGFFNLPIRHRVARLKLAVCVINLAILQGIATCKADASFAGEAGHQADHHQINEHSNIAYSDENSEVEIEAVSDREEGERNEGNERASIYDDAEENQQESTQPILLEETEKEKSQEKRDQRNVTEDEERDVELSRPTASRANKDTKSKKRDVEGVTSNRKTHSDDDKPGPSSRSDYPQTESTKNKNWAKAVKESGKKQAQREKTKKPDGAETSSDEDTMDTQETAELVSYTRHGIQHFRKKRGSGSQSSTSRRVTPYISNRGRGAGRGKGNEKV